MGDLLIRSIPDDLRRGLVDSATRDNRSLSAAATEAIRRGLDAIGDASPKPKTSLFDAI